MSRNNDDVLYWKDKNGKKHLISDMSDKVLLSKIKAMEKQAINPNTKKVDGRKLSTGYHLLKLNAVARNIL